MKNLIYINSFFILIMCILSFSTTKILAQKNVKTYSLQELISISQQKSISYLKAKTSKENSFWKWKSFKSDYNPQMVLNSTLPEFDRSFYETVQPDGSIRYQPISSLKTNMSLQLSQGISKTGGTIFFQSDLQRYDDLVGDQKQYRTVPFQIGIIQPILQYNALKWNKEIEPLKYQESLKAYFEDIERIGLTTTILFFSVLKAHMNLQIANTNVENTQKVLDIATQRNILGKNSKNDLLQLKLAFLNAQKKQNKSKVDSENAELNLKIHVGLKGHENLNLHIPDLVQKVPVHKKTAIEQAQHNRKDPIAFNRRTKEAEAFVAKAKGENGFSADLSVSLGFNNSTTNLKRVYQDANDQQYISMSVTVPILDWGRSKSRIKTALANQQLIQYTVDQDKINFEQEVNTQVDQFHLFFDQLEFTEQADKIANERYQIALKHFGLGGLSITNLIIAMNEKDQAKVDYVSALEDYWTSFYQLRLLTLYDFRNNKKIEYQ